MATNHVYRAKPTSGASQPRGNQPHLSRVGIHTGLGSTPLTNKGPIRGPHRVRIKSDQIRTYMLNLRTEERTKISVRIWIKIYLTEVFLKLFMMYIG